MLVAVSKGFPEEGTGEEEASGGGGVVVVVELELCPKEKECSDSKPKREAKPPCTHSF